jgi:transaldolase
MGEEARAAVALAPERVVIKLPATALGVRAAAALRDEGIRCALTAVYAPAQALLAQALGCEWVIPYVDRAARQGLDSGSLLGSLAKVLHGPEGRTRILAASLKTGEQVVESILCGADDVTVPPAVLAGLADHPLSEAAAREFEAETRPETRPK